MAAFPLNHNSQGWDSKLYKVSKEDKSIRTEMDGGYMTSRPRHTRAARRTWTIGWKSMLNADKLTLETFWDTVAGGSDSFTWTEPDTSTVYTVRFKGPINFEYAGMGNTKLWDVTLSLEQV
jgi:phage-related protein